MGIFGKIVGKAVNDAIYKASDGRKAVSTDYSMAAINIIKRKIEDITLFISVLASVIFLCFYGFMIYSKPDVFNIVIYSVLSFLLIVSTILDVILFKASRKEMNFLEKRSFNWYKKIKRNSLLFFKLFIKLFSIGFAIFEIIKYGSTTSRMIGITLSIVALVVQLSIHFLSGFITDCINYVVIGISMDVDNSGILYLVDKNKAEKQTSNEYLRTKSDKKIIEDLEAQKKKDRNEKRDDDEIKIKFGKYQLECKNKAKEYIANEKRLEELIKACVSQFDKTNIANHTPGLFYEIFYMVQMRLDKKFELDDEGYINAVAFLVYYDKIYDSLVEFESSNEKYIIDKILPEIKGIEEFRKFCEANKEK